MKKRSRLWIIPVVIVSVFILALLLTAIFWTETFNWKSTVSASTINSIRGLTFNPITYRYFDGFTNKSIAQKYSECINIPTNVEAFNKLLKVEGGICKKYFTLELTENGIKSEISTRAELARLLGPVDSEKKAVAFLYAIWPDLKYTNNGELVGSVAKTEDGYIVKAFRNNTFGCGIHYPVETIFKITLNGEIEGIASVKDVFNSESRNPQYIFGCVD